MRALRVSVILMVLGGVPSCTAAQTLTVEPLFGPVIGRDPIVGRADVDGRVLLLVRDVGLISIDFDRREARTTALPAEAMKTYWGLARLADGTLWTLKDRHTLARIGEGGTIEKEFALANPHLGLVAMGPRLVYQRMAAQPGSLVFDAGGPGQDGRVAWLPLAPRALRLAPAAALPLNLFTCGESRTGERPCWFPDETAVSLVGDRDTARRVELPGLTRVPPEVLVTSENPARPIRAAYVDGEGGIWILSSGSPPAGIAGTGAWLLGRYDADGKMVFLRPLAAPARAILRVTEGRVVLLASDGRVVEVRP